MFDANMCHLPEGFKFFVTGYISKGSPLQEICTKETKILKCTMLSKGSKNPTVTFKNTVNSLDVNITLSEDDTGDDWLHYAGTINGSGFICDKVRAEAEKLGFEEYSTI